MPSIRPSRALSRSRTASVTSGARKNAVMNLAEPSGSSPPEKPPGIMTIWLCADAAGKLVGALGDGLGREVVDHEGVGLGAGCAEGTGAIVLAVVAGEHGDDHARAGDLGAAVHVDVLGAEVDGLDLGGLAGAAVGEDALDAALPGLLELGELDDLGAGVDDIALDGGTQGLDDNAVGDLGQLGVLGELDDKAAVERGEEALHVHILGKLDADLVADAHLKEALGAAAVAGRGDGQGVTGGGERLDGVKRGEQLLGVGAVILAVGGGGDAHDAVRQALELGRDGAGGACPRRRRS